MKKLLALLLALGILLCGCAGDQTPVDTETTTTSTTTTPPPEEPTEEDFGIYQPESDVEKATAGAVKQYALEGWDYYGLCTLGDGLLLLSGQRDTTLTYIAPDGTTATATVKDQMLYPENITVVDGDCVAYYDGEANAMILRNTAMEEVAKVTIPDGALEGPLVTSNWTRLYYITETQLRYLDIETGIDRLLREMCFATQWLQALHFDGSVIQCMVNDEYDAWSLLISAENGTLLYETDDMPSLNTQGDSYFAQLYQNGVPQYLYGTREGKPQCLNVEQNIILNAPAMGIAVSWEELEEETVLSCYDLKAGTRSSETRLPITDGVLWMCADAKRQSVWFITLNQDQETSLYRWDLTMSLTGDTTSWVTPYYTVEEPDKEGLARIEQWAQELGRTYGIRVQVYEDALIYQPSDYTFQPQHQVPVYDRYMKQLEAALARYPEGFLRKLGSTSDNGKLTISLVGAMYGDNQLGSLDTADGVHFYNDGSVYIALTTGSAFEATLYHELFHAIDTYVMSRNNLYDFWEDLNPDGFAYDNDYVTNQFREDYQYLEGDRWFIDMYSMSYAKEDRARIMEYAMQSGNEEYFESPHMQAKLAKLSEGIRKAFGIKSGSLPWEQYLK